MKFDSVKNALNFKFSDTLMVIYEKDKSLLNNMIRKDLTPEKQQSFLLYKTLLFLTGKDGVFIDAAGVGIPNVLYTIGEMGNRRLAYQLPFDFIYKPQPLLNY